MSNQTDTVYLQAIMVSSEPAEGIAFDTSYADQTYQVTPWKPSSTGIIAVSPQSKGGIVRSIFSNVPVVEYGKLRSEYRELGEALSEMTELDAQDEWKIEAPVYDAARYVAVQLMANAFPPPQLFNHGAKSVVFNWSNKDNNLYLTVSADKISALISSPERIKCRVDVDFSRLPNTIYALSSSVEDEAYERQIVLFVTGAISESSLLPG